MRQEIKLSADSDCPFCYGAGTRAPDGYNIVLCHCVRTGKVGPPRHCLECQDTGYTRASGIRQAKLCRCRGVK